MASICRACFNICGNSDTSSIEGELEKMLSFCIPEIDLNISRNPVLCENCQLALKNAHDFKKKCLETQEKIVILTCNSPKVVETPKVIKAVAPFKSKLNNFIIGSECSENDYITENLVPKLREQPLNYAEDFLMLLENSDNVNVCNLSNVYQNLDCKSSKSSNESADDAENILEPEDIATNHHPHSSDHVDFQCSYCDYKTKYRFGLNKHRQICPNRPVSENKNKIEKATSFSCKYCRFTAKKRAVLAMHISRKHNMKMEDLSCDACDFRTGTTTKLISHFKKAHSKHFKSKSESMKKKKVVESSINYECLFDNCNKNFKTEKERKVHHQSHLPSSGGSLQCDICNQIFSTKKGFRIHYAHHMKSKGKQKISKVKSETEIDENLINIKEGRPREKEPIISEKIQSIPETVTNGDQNSNEYTHETEEHVEKSPVNNSGSRVKIDASRKSTEKNTSVLSPREENQETALFEIGEVFTLNLSSDDEEKTKSMRDENESNESENKLQKTESSGVRILSQEIITNKLYV